MMLENLKISIGRPTITTIKDLAIGNIIKWKTIYAEAGKDNVVIEDRTVSGIDDKSVWVKGQSKVGEEHGADIVKVKAVNPNLKSVVLSKVEDIELYKLSYNGECYYRIYYIFNNGVSNIIHKGVPFTIGLDGRNKIATNQGLINLINSLGKATKMSFEKDEKNMFIINISDSKKK